MKTTFDKRVNDFKKFWYKCKPNYSDSFLAGVS